MKIYQFTLSLFLLSAILMPPPSKADGDDHIHGRGQAKVSVAGDKVEIQLSLPVYSILGFERKPKSKERQQALARAEAMLLQVDSVVKPAAASECKLSSKSLKVKRFKKKRHHQHADFVLLFKFRCVQPAELNQIKFVLFDSFPKLKNLDVVFSHNAKRAHAKELTRRQDTLLMVSE